MPLAVLLDDYALLARRRSRRCRTRYAARRDMRSIERMAALDGILLPTVRV